MKCEECHIKHSPQNADASGWAKAVSAACLARLKYFNLATRVWATNHNGALPPDFLSMTNELKTPNLLFCLANHERRLGTWSGFVPWKADYEIRLISEATNGSSPAYITCRIHGHQLFPDGRIVPGR